MCWTDFRVLHMVRSLTPQSYPQAFSTKHTSISNGSPPSDSPACTADVATSPKQMMDIQPVLESVRASLGQGL